MLSLPIIVLLSTQLVLSAPPAPSLAAQFSLTTSTSIPFPSATQSNLDTQSHIVSKWSLSKGRIQNGEENLAFVDDPFPTSKNASGDPVLQVTYSAGSYSHDSGGTQMYSLWNSSIPFQSMMLSYEVAFDNGFDWVKGGKLPGIRGGIDPNGCSGGDESDGKTCFSSRLMWRKRGDAEAYLYIPTPNGLCNSTGVICNSDFGTSVGRGSFSWASGKWNRVTLLVQLNDPPNIANGNLQLFYNDLQAISRQDLQFRSNSNVTAGGLYLSTFFGGNDDSWATPTTTHTYFRNFQIWGGSTPSKFTGQRVSGAKKLALGWGISVVSFIIFLIGMLH